MFQKSVLESYLKSVDKKKVSEAFEVFKKYYGNQERLQNIADSKEEQYQEGFLRDLFVNVFGYTINPDPNYNLTTEFKNLQDAKKADGAILKDGKPVAVIELKSNKTKNLESIQDQAFRYKNGQKDCRYVITSNFRLIRFYVDDATEYEEFNLFDIKEHEFELMYFLLNKENIFADVPFKLKTASKVHEESISNKLYTDYSVFREEIYQNIIQKNPALDKLELYKKTQKLLDRFLFIFFAEDRGLIPPNSIYQVIETWHELKEKDAYSPLYERVVKFFGYLDKGRNEIHAYNGGLFKEDALLDELIVDDEILEKHCIKLTNYDFDSEVDVNILGHIFEHSLGEVEAKEAEIVGKKVEKSKSKRKKDGVFYTPKYITKYIVENTIGTLCRDKKQQIGLYDIDLSLNYKKTKGKKKDLNEKGKQIKEIFEDYKKWLFRLKILDPACGSGAFLNEALDYLIREHVLIDDMLAELTGDKLRLTDTDKEILEHNLYGVDINEESVEIAKLSLWLRTAQKGRKLSNLNNNIKCGNSLIDDSFVAGEKAFKWNQEFKEIMDNGGFDVVIGNPPYGAELTEEQISYIKKKYTVYEYKLNSYVLFYEKAFELLKTDGLLGFITPATFTYQYYYKILRSFLGGYTTLFIAKYFYEVFSDADIGDSVSVVMKKANNNYNSVHFTVNKTKEESSVNLHEVIEYDKIFNNDGTLDLNRSLLNIRKFLTFGKPLNDFCQIVVGVKPYQKNKGVPKQTEDDVKLKKFTAFEKKNDTYVNCIVGKDIGRYRFLSKPQMYLSYGKWLAEPRLNAPFFEAEKIILRQTADSIIATIDFEKKVNLNNVYNIGHATNGASLKYLLGLINSKLLNLIYQNISQEKGRNFAEVKKINLKRLPIIISEKYKTSLEDLVDKIISNTNHVTYKTNMFAEFLRHKFGMYDNVIIYNKVSQMMFSEIINEINTELIRRDLKKISMKDELELLALFDEYKKDVRLKEIEIMNIDNQIDSIVYSIYGLTPEEIQIVESSI